MKIINFLLRSFISLFAIIICLTILYYHNIAITPITPITPITLYCEGATPESLDTLFWKIEEQRDSVWHVLFRNVNIKYEVMMCIQENDTVTTHFEFREIGPNYPGLFRPDSLDTMFREDRIKHILKNNQAYTIHPDSAMHLTGSLDPNLVYIEREHNNLIDACMAHFNSIQRGEFHPNAKNLINPNAHGKGKTTAVLDNVPNTFIDPSSFTILSKVPNTFGDTKNKPWPADNLKANKNKSWPAESSKANSKNKFSPAESSKANSKSKFSLAENSKFNIKINCKSNNNLGHGSRGDSSSSSNDANGSDDDEPDQPHEANSQFGRGIRSPLDQFIVRNWLTFTAPLLGNLSINYTNMGFYLTIVTFIIIALSALAINYEKIVANSWSTSQESTYATVYNIVVNQINAIKGQYFYPFIYCLFVFILTSNLVGMIPYNFAPTSHFALTFFISFTVVLGSTFLGFILHKLGFFSLFVPQGCPLGLLPLLVLIEFISYLARNISLGLRLAANILSGHMLLNILSEFTYNMIETSFSSIFTGTIPFAFIGAFSCLEFGIGFIQAQVFSVLSSSYIKDGLSLH